MIVEFTDGDGRSVLVNPNKLIAVQEETVTKRARLILEGNVHVNVRQTFEEIKKRLGLAITFRAETIADQSG